MNYGLYLSAAGLRAQQARQTVTTNNLANAQTTGFKRDLAIMQARANAAYEDPRMFPYRLPVVKDQGGGVLALGDGLDLTQATLESTGNATDLALDGRGFFTVAGDQGERLLTRDGRFLIDNQGKLVMASGGRAVLDDAGREITVNAALPLVVDADGTLSQGGVALAKLGLVDVSDSRRLVKLGGNLIRPERSESMVAVNAATMVRQGTLESSGVDPMVEMVNLIEAQRAFEANARMITYQDQTMAQLNAVGRVA